MTKAMRKKAVDQQAAAAPAVPNTPLTPEERERYNVDDRVDKMMKKHNLSREDAEEVVREVVVTKEMPGDSKKAKPTPEPDAEPQPVAKGVTGPLGALLNGQRFYVKGVVGNFILEGWQLAPGVLSAPSALSIAARRGPGAGCPPALACRMAWRVPASSAPPAAPRACCGSGGGAALPLA